LADFFHTSLDFLVCGVERHDDTGVDVLCQELSEKELRTLVKGNEKTELTEEVIRTLISRIEVYPDHRVKVIFNFKRNEVQIRKEGV